MARYRTWTTVALVTAAIGLQSGCSSSSLATVSGQVTYDGQPVADGFITFTPADGKGAEAGGQIVNGKYELTRVQPGPKVVKVIGVKKVNFASTSDEMMRKAAVARKSGNHDGLVDPADTIPEAAEGNNAKIDITAGDNKHDLRLSKPAGKK
jgi:hypothetical protein